MSERLADPLWLHSIGFDRISVSENVLCETFSLSDMRTDRVCGPPLFLASYRDFLVVWNDGIAIPSLGWTFAGPPLRSEVGAGKELTDIALWAATGEGRPPRGVVCP